MVSSNFWAYSVAKPPDPQATVLQRRMQEDREEDFSTRPELSSDAPHRANTILGLVAADRGDLDAAAQFLIASGKVATSPVLGSFGPNMSLAQALLKKGQPQPVLEYFQLCSAFWKMGKDRLDQWTSDVKAGDMPNFGASLLY